MTTERLSDGTQVLELRDAYDAVCRCGAALTWTFDAEERYSATAECSECPMRYRSSMARVTIEGMDMSLY